MPLCEQSFIEEVLHRCGWVLFKISALSVLSWVEIWECIAVLQINNRSIQDLHIFEDPSHIPIVIVERVVSAPVRSGSGDSYFSAVDHKDTNSFVARVDSALSSNQSGSPRQNGRVLRIVVFVHGFQACYIMIYIYSTKLLWFSVKGVNNHLKGPNVFVSGFFSLCMRSNWC